MRSNVNLESVKDVDEEIYDLICAEADRQESVLEMIASENFSSDAVRAACGSVLTNKYSEGYPGRRYYGGCDVVDQIENIAIRRACELFGAEYANVQPHSGSQANFAAYIALGAKPGDTILALGLDEGGHLTHGSSVNFSGKLYNIETYKLNKDGYIDMNNVREVALRCNPKIIVAGTSAYARIIDYKAFREVADEVGAKLMVDMAHIAGLVAAGVHPSPIPYADIVTTTTHKTLRGPRSGLILCKNEYARAVDSAVFPYSQGGPLQHIIAAKAICFKEAMLPEFREYMKQVVKNASLLASELKGYGFNLVSGGTDVHLVLLDLRNKGITGKEMESRLESVGIATNKNCVPGDTRRPTVTSGLRVGTAAITTRGMVESDIGVIARIFYDVIEDYEGTFEKNREIVRKLCAKYPLFQ